MTYYRCPECLRKGVHFRFAANGEDHYRCKYCEFYTYNSDEFASDAVKLRNLAAANPGAPIWTGE